MKPQSAHRTPHPKYSAHPFCSQSPKRVGSAPRRDPFGPPISPVSAFFQANGPSSSCTPMMIRTMSRDGMKWHDKTRYERSLARMFEKVLDPYFFNYRHVIELFDRLLLHLARHCRRRTSRRRPAAATATTTESTKGASWDITLGRCVLRLGVDDLRPRRQQTRDPAQCGPLRWADERSR